MYSITYNINTIEKKLVLGLFFSVFLMFLIYGYFVNATIVNIIERKVTEERAGELIAEISNLESEYGSLRSRITYKYAYSLGFEQPKRQVFALYKQLVTLSPVR